jgi:hypothetical protein
MPGGLGRFRRDSSGSRRRRCGALPRARADHQVHLVIRGLQGRDPVTQRLVAGDQARSARTATAFLVRSGTATLSSSIAFRCFRSHRSLLKQASAPTTPEFATRGLSTCAALMFLGGFRATIFGIRSDRSPCVRFVIRRFASDAPTNRGSLQLRLHLSAVQRPHSHGHPAQSSG